MMRLLAQAAIFALVSVNLLTSCVEGIQSGSSGNKSAAAQQQPSAPLASDSVVIPETEEQQQPPPPHIEEQWLALEDSERMALEARDFGLEWWQKYYADDSPAYLANALQYRILACKPFSERLPVDIIGMGPVWQELDMGQELKRWGLEGMLRCADMDGDGELELLYQSRMDGGSELPGIPRISDFAGNIRSLDGLQGKEITGLFDVDADGMLDLEVLDWKAIHASGGSGGWMTRFFTQDGTELPGPRGLSSYRPRLLADLDGDGHQNLVCWDWSGNDSELQVFGVNGEEILNQKLIAMDSSACSIRVDDSGREALVMQARHAPHGVSLMKLDPEYGMLMGDTLPWIEGHAPPQCAIDIDGDGIDELLCGSEIIGSDGSVVSLQAPQGWREWKPGNLWGPEVAMARMGGKELLVGIPERQDLDMIEDMIVFWSLEGSIVCQQRFGVDISSFAVSSNGTHFALMTDEEILLGSFSE